LIWWLLLRLLRTNSRGLLRDSAPAWQAKKMRKGSTMLELLPHLPALIATMDATVIVNAYWTAFVLAHKLRAARRKKGPGVVRAPNIRQRAAL
jgi:hypothetical protein